VSGEFGNTTSDHPYSFGGFTDFMAVDDAVSPVEFEVWRVGFNPDPSVTYMMLKRTARRV
jgi:hypothetical protein